jgi:hypothetical protein
MTEKCWKRAERRIAELLGGHRVPVSGRQRGDAPDVDHPTLSIEVKTRKSIPAWIEDAMKQAEASARDGQVPVAVLHQSGQRYRDALLVMRLGDLGANEPVLWDSAWADVRASQALQYLAENFPECCGLEALDPTTTLSTTRP